MACRVAERVKVDPTTADGVAVVWLNRPVITLGIPRQPAQPPSCPIAAAVCRDREQPRFQIAGVAVVLEVMEQLEERLLHDVLGIAGVAQHASAEAIQPRAMFLKQPQRLGLRIDSGRCRAERSVNGFHPTTRDRSHSGSWMLNGEEPGL